MPIKGIDQFSRNMNQTLKILAGTSSHFLGTLVSNEKT
jgi:hypothetical protein